MNDFLSSYFYAQELYDNKLNTLKENIVKFQNQLENNELNNLFDIFLNDIFIVLYDKINNYKTLLEDNNRNAFILNKCVGVS